MISELKSGQRPGVSNKTLDNLGALSGFRHRLECEPASHGDSVLHGELAIVRQFSGLTLHCCDVIEMQDAQASLQVPAGFCLSVVFAGELGFSLDGQPHHLKLPPGSPAQAFAYNLLCPSQWQKRMLRGNAVRKVTLSVQREWLDGLTAELGCTSAAVQPVLRQHRSFHNWSANSQLVAVAQQIMTLAASAKLVDRILLEAKSFELLATGLQALADTPQQAAAQLTSAQQPLSAEAQKLLRYLEEQVLCCRPSEAPSLVAIAEANAMSVSKLQRVFKKAMGQTVMDFLRLRRLQRAREGLLKRQLSISEAAFYAGYSHVSNFHNAFKRQFGRAPGELLQNS